MKKRFFYLFFLFSFTFSLWGQKPPENLSEFEQSYQKRIRKDVLFGVYIPKDLPDAFRELDKKIDEASKTKMKVVPEEAVADKLFYGLGRWMIHNWGFYGGSRLSNYIRGLGIFHPEDMSRFLLLGYHRKLNGQELNIPGLMKLFHAKQNKEKQELIQKGEVLYEKSRKRPKPVDDQQ